MPRTSTSPLDSAAVGAAIRQGRIATGITQTALGERLDVTAAYVHKLEAGRGNPTIAMLARVARALDAELVVDFPLRPSQGVTPAEMAR
ncbi:MAG: helix-turn-helix domain-containing protein [Solirubrobacterales bacterium]